MLIKLTGVTELKGIANKPKTGFKKIWMNQKDEPEPVRWDLAGK